MDGHFSSSKFVPMQLNVGAVHDVCISHVFQSGKFCCQLVENATNLDWLMKSLQTLPRTNLYLPETNEGEACLAARDGFVYRCKIIEKQSDGAIVKFVDFGDEACVPEIDLYQIDAEFLRFPVQGIRCSVDGAEAMNLLVLLQVSVMKTCFGL